MPLLMGINTFYGKHFEMLKVEKNKCKKTIETKQKILCFAGRMLVKPTMAAVKIFY